MTETLFGLDQLVLVQSLDANQVVGTTLIVFGMVLIVGIVLWLFDTVLLNIVRSVTG